MVGALVAEQLSYAIGSRKSGLQTPRSSTMSSGAEVANRCLRVASTFASPNIRLGEMRSSESRKSPRDQLIKVADQLGSSAFM
jgi:hypothetical protein